MPPTPGPGPHAVRLMAGAGSYTVGGLDGPGRDRIVTAWSRCAPTVLDEGAEAADTFAVDHASWDAFHERVVYGATAATITAGRGSRLMLHAACLADPASGAAIALTAASGTGKTTATRRLGPYFAYLTDETAIVDPASLAVTPYAKPLSLLGADGHRPKSQAGPDELGLGVTVEDAQLTRIAVLDRMRDPQERVAARAERMPLVAALSELVPQTSSLSHLPRGLVTLCSVLDRLGGAQRLVYAEADELRPVVEELLATPPVPFAPEWEPLEQHELAASAPVEADQANTGTERLLRIAATDGVALRDGTLLLLEQERLTVLEGLGPALWLLLSEPRSIAELVTGLGDLGPVPDDAEARVREAVDTLTTHGLLIQEQAPEPQ